MTGSHRVRIGGVGAIAAAAVLVGIVQGDASVVGVADAKPSGSASGSHSSANRGPNKATPQRTTDGSSQSTSRRSSGSDSGDSSGRSSRYEQNRGPNKNTPGDTAFNDDDTRSGAEPDRGAHKVRPGDVSTTPRAQSNGGHADFRDHAPRGTSSQSGSTSGSSIPSVRGDADAPTRDGAASGGGSPTIPGANGDADTATGTQSGAGSPSLPNTRPPATAPPSSNSAQRVAPQPDAAATNPGPPQMPVRIGSTADGANVPGSSIISCDNGCMTSTDRSYGTTRVFTPDQITADRNPLTSTVTISEANPDSRSGFWDVNTTSNPMGGGGGIPVPDLPGPNTGVGAGGNVSKPGKGGGVIEGKVIDKVELRVARAVPTGTYPVQTQFGPGTAVNYRYEYEKRTIVGGTIAGIGPSFRSDWSPATRADVDNYLNRGVHLPPMAQPHRMTP